MTATIFVETNVLVYRRDAGQGEKQARAAAWMERLWEARKGERPLTTLVGSLTDRSALLGVLNTLHDLNLTLLSVEVVDND